MPTASNEPWSDVYVVVLDARTRAVVACWKVWQYMADYWMRCARMLFPNPVTHVVTWQTEECASWKQP